jgi:RNA polymerase sigma-70 factor, ECF subfamily
LTEPELLNKIKSNPEAFSELFKLYYKPIFGYIFRRTGDFDETADIASETFSKAFTNIKNFYYRGISIKIWLYRIATNEVNLFYRYRKKRNLLFERIDFENKELFKDHFHWDKKELQTELEKHEQFRIILEALKKMPDRYQTVISLRYFEGMNNKEICEILNLKEGTLKSLLSRGLKKLKEECNQL